MLQPPIVVKNIIEHGEAEMTLLVACIIIGKDLKN
jgi:hypothetical protein